ncbi:MAG: YggT family protein [Candidatus Methylumidiphilus alinenensis]|uniref:YggT family protein n=1 Tax=Candidatus Methylumidiphilus alinenensis TaxID=2202197 RepID=A0A2W4S892_9GAMM|nr:MAG: YggT family protein [Candidatus Methylumidiphilus alinenensis]
MLRFLLQWAEADFYNPISQFLVKLTHPPLRYLRRFIPSVRRIDSASLVLMLAVQILSDYLVFTLQQISASPASLLLVALGQLLELLYNILFYSILISVVLSWVAPRGYNPAMKLLYDLTDPLLAFFRRFLPPMGGIDISPLLALVALQFAKMAIMPLLQQMISALN